MDGVLIVDKPAGMTSHDVVAVVRRVAGERKVGHTGTLDPLATGVLVLCLGAATKALSYLPEGSKTYLAEATLGWATDTQDRTGRTIEEKRDCAVTLGGLRRTLASFAGDSMQLPPMYSAVQVGGERLYRLARDGYVVARRERPVTITAIELAWPDGPDESALGYGERFRFTVTGRRGLYVRTLCHDLGQRLGCGAHLAELRRLASGPYLLGHAVALDGLTKDRVAAALLPLDAALAHLPGIRLDEPAATRVRHGNPVPAAERGAVGPARAVDPAGRVFAILAYREGFWWPVRVFFAD